MRQFYRLMNAQFSELVISVLSLCVTLIAASWLLVLYKIKDYNQYAVHERFEDIYAASGMPIVFLICVLAVIAIFVKSFYSSYWGSKSIYTLLTLPVKRELVYLSKLCSFGISILMLLCAQLLGFILAYNYMASKIANYSNGELEVTNGLFLAFIRSDFMRLLWPYGFANVLSTVSIFIVIITWVYHLVLCERSQRRLGGALIAAVFWPIYLVVTMRLDAFSSQGSFNSYDSSKLILYSAILLVISVICVWHSIVLLRKGATT